MISIVDVWRSVQGTAKKTTTGYQTKDKFNDDVELVQLTIIKALCELYEKEEVISDDLMPFVVRIKGVPKVKPSDYFRFISATINNEEVYPVHRNAVTMTKNSPIRGSLNTFYFQENFISFNVGSGKPIIDESSEFMYIRRPKKALLNLVYSDDGGDYVTPVSIEDLEWPESVRNLIESMLLERLGVETREAIAIEFGRMGIERETSNYK